MSQRIEIGGAVLWKSYLDPSQQLRFLDHVRDLVRQAPLFRPETRQGRPLSVRMSAAGRFGWISDRFGYRYAGRHPSGVSWPDIPEDILEIWRRLSGSTREPECCLINYYDKDARLGLHQDRDEADLTQPVLSLSLGDDARFRIGGAKRGDKTVSHWLQSGDVVLLSGEGRLAFHGVDRIRYGSSSLLPNGGRINLTLRVVS